MPHSTGGGSHGGGFHSSGSFGGGSHHSSGSSFHSSGNSFHRSSTPPPPPPRMQPGFFPGAHLYMYHVNNRPVYMYANDSAAPSKSRMSLWLFFAPFLAVLLFCIASELMPRSAISLPADQTVVVEDGASCLGDQKALQTAMDAFRQRTGIVPAVVTVTDETWKTNYRELGTYAYDQYVNRFNDERHWLIVYSQPADSDSASFVGWSWEGMAGDDTGDLIDYDCREAFGSALQKGLTKTSTTVGQALADAFTAATASVSSSHADMSFVTFLGAVFVILLVVALFSTGTVRTGKQKPNTLPKDAVRAEAPADQPACAYCGGIFPATDLNCPYCGAPRKSV